MPNANYQRGMRWEARAREDLEARHYWVIQTRGSKTPADIVAIKAHVPVVMAQIKSPGVSYSHHDWNALHELASMAGAVALVCQWVPVDGPGSALRPLWHEIRGWHEIRSRLWPMSTWGEMGLRGSPNGL